MIALQSSHLRLFCGLTFLIASFVLSACSSGNTVSGSIRSLEIDPGKGTVRSLRVSLQNDRTSDAQYDFVVRDNDNSTFWRPTVPLGAFQSGENREFTLIPETVVRPYVGDTVSLFTVRKDTGAESFIDGYVVTGKTMSIINSDFTLWHQDGTQPIAWQASVQDPHAIATYQKATQGGRNGVQMILGSSQVGIWHVASLNQRVDSRAVLGTSIYPSADCDALQRQPSSVLGLRFHDDANNALVFCISPRVKRAEVRQLSDGHQLIVVLPGRLNAWNQIEADPSRYLGFIRLHGDSNGLVSVGPYLALQPVLSNGGAQKNRISATFGNVSVMRRH